MTIYRKMIRCTWIPWRIRHRLETWVEKGCYHKYPKLYQWLHFGRFTPIPLPLTKGPKHHFFGYYDKSPWNSSDRYILAHEADFNDRPPNAEDKVTIGIIDTFDNNRFFPLSESHAWNWQQGSMLQWHPLDPEYLVIYNDREKDRFIGIVRNINDGEVRIYENPFYALLPDGTIGFSLNFSRLARHRPGYGYAGGYDKFSSEQAPDRDGIWAVDIQTGKSELIVSLAQLANVNPKPSMRQAWHYINHIQPSKNGGRIAFFHVWHQDDKKWEVRLYSCRPDGTELTCLLDTGFISHYDWKDDEHILVWANRPGATYPCFLILDHSGSPPKPFAEKLLQEDGHCSFSPDGNWILNDTYPDIYQKRTLMLVHRETEQRIDLARLHSPKSRWWGEIRCDLHPRWNHSGTSICIDSVHEGTRQMYTVDVSKWVK